MRAGNLAYALRFGIGVIGTAALAACSSASLPSLPDVGSLNPFSEEEVRLEGERVAVLAPQDDLTVDEGSSKTPVKLAAARANADWPQPGGTTLNAPGHLALEGSLKRLWSASAGTGSSSDGRLSASPIVYGGRIFTLDARGRVTSFSASTGGQVWRVGLAPAHEDDDEGFGGGLAAADGRIYAATGFGTVVALDAADGKTVWSKSLGVPVRVSPTVDGDKIYIITTDATLHALSTVDGQELWSRRGLPESASLLSNVSPAVTGAIVVAPYPSGEIVAYKTADGQPIWSESLSRARRVSSLTALSDTSRPAIDRGVVYAVGHAGRMIATVAKSGERLWSKSIAGTQTPVISGDTVFTVDVGGRVVALARKDGAVRWIAELPKSRRWAGPVLAGDRLWLVSSSGILISVDAKTGEIGSKRDLDEAVYIAPIVAAGRLYILTDEARLIAMN